MAAGKMKRFRRGGGLRRTQRTQVKSIVRSLQETKFIVDTQAWTDVGIHGGSPKIVSMLTIGQGDTDILRTGSEIWVQKVQGRFLFRLEGNQAVDPQCAIRVMVLQARGSVLVAADLPTYSGDADLNKMFVLYDKIMNVSASIFDTVASTFDGTSTSPVFNIKLKKFPKKLIHYDNANVNPLNNGIYLYMVAENVAGQYSGYLSLYFKDA